MKNDKLLPIVQASLVKYKMVYEVIDCDPDLADTAAFCEKYGYLPSQSANTILVASKKTDPITFAVCVVLATTRLDVNKKVCELLGVKKASFASAEDTVTQTGMMIGGVVAIGISGMPIYVDSAVMKENQIIMGAGNRSSKILLSPKELLKVPGLAVVEGLAKPKE